MTRRSDNRDRVAGGRQEERSAIPRIVRHVVAVYLILIGVLGIIPYFTGG